MFRGSGAATLRALERIPPVCPPSCPALSLCDQTGCCTPSWSLGTTATTSSARTSHGDAASAGMGRCHGQSPVFEVMGRLCDQVEGKLPSLPSLPLCPFMCCILSSISGAQLPLRHPPQVPLPGSSARSWLPPGALGEPNLLLLRFHPSETFFIINPRKRLRRITLIK